MIEQTISMIGRVPSTLSAKELSKLGNETGLWVNAHDGECEFDLSDVVNRSMDRPGDPWKVGDEVLYNPFDLRVKYSLQENLN